MPSRPLRDHAASGGDPLEGSMASIRPARDFPVAWRRLSSQVAVVLPCFSMTGAQQ